MATTNSNFKVKNGLDAGGTITATGLSSAAGVALPISTANNTTASGAITIQTGTTSSGIGGITSGSITIATGAGAGAGNASGAILIQTGNGSGSTGPSGSVTIDTGTGSGTAAGTILIGTTNTSALTIGRTGVTTTVNGTLLADVITAASSSSTTADIFGNVTTGTVGIADGLTTGTLNIGNGTTSSTGRTININTNASSTVTVTTNIGSPVIGSTINLVAGSPGVVLTSTGLITTSAVTGGASSIMTIRTGNTTTSGNSGNLFLDVGSAAGTAGTVSVGTSSASGVSIGRAGITTSVTGTLNQAGASSPIQLNSQAGTTGQVLTSAGAGNTPTWTTPASHTLISSVAFTSAPSFTSIPQTYKRLYAVIVFATLGTFSGALVYSVNGAGTGYSRFQPGVSTTFTTSAGASAVLTLAATPPVVGDSYWVEINNYTQTNSRSIGSGSVYTFGNVIPAAVTSFAFGGSTTFGTATGTAYLYGVN